MAVRLATVAAAATAKAATGQLGAGLKSQQWGMSSYLSIDHTHVLTILQTCSPFPKFEKSFYEEAPTVAGRLEEEVDAFCKTH